MQSVISKLERTLAEHQGELARAAARNEALRIRWLAAHLIGRCLWEIRRHRAALGASGGGAPSGEREEEDAYFERVRELLACDGAEGSEQGSSREQSSGREPGSCSGGTSAGAQPSPGSTGGASTPSGGSGGAGGCGSQPGGAGAAASDAASGGVAGQMARLSVGDGGLLDGLPHLWPGRSLLHLEG